jgi:putative colanic acid biosynthesis acetyltransferase WcaF
VDLIVLEEYSIISQRVYLCTASHDINNSDFHLVTQPITICSRAWVAADAFVGMGVIIGEGAVVGARASVFKNVDSWTVVGGNPAKVIKKREMMDVTNK